MRDDLRAALDTMAARGEPRDADEVLDAAAEAARRHRTRRIAAAVVAVAAALGGAAVVAGTGPSTDVTAGPGTTVAGRSTETGPGPGEVTFDPPQAPAGSLGPVDPDATVVRDRDRDLVAALVAFARAPDLASASYLAFSDGGVELGLGEDLLARRTPAELRDRARWELDRDGFRGRVGPFSALAVLAGGRPYQVSVGPHAHCASTPVPAPAAVAGLRRVSAQPTDADGCLDWFSVDVYVDASGVIHAVTLDLWDP